jgi:hypothetical protein
MIPLETGECNIPLSEQHVWSVALDTQGTKQTGRKCWHVVYRGPAEQCIGWVRVRSLLGVVVFFHKHVFIFFMFVPHFSAMCLFSCCFLVVFLLFSCSGPLFLTVQS